MEPVLVEFTKQFEAPSSIYCSYHINITVTIKYNEVSIDNVFCNTLGDLSLVRTRTNLHVTSNVYICTL